MGTLIALYVLCVMGTAAVDLPPNPLLVQVTGQQNQQAEVTDSQQERQQGPQPLQQGGLGPQNPPDQVNPNPANKPVDRSVELDASGRPFLRRVAGVQSAGASGSGLSQNAAPFSELLTQLRTLDEGPAQTCLTRFVTNVTASTILATRNAIAGTAMIQLRTARPYLDQWPLVQTHNQVPRCRDVLQLLCRARLIRQFVDSLRRNIGLSTLDNLNP